MKKLLLFCALLASTFSYAQVFETKVNTSFQFGNFSLEPTEDGGYIMFCGSQYSALQMIKFDSLGNVSWSKYYNEYGMDVAASLGKNRIAVYGNYTTNYWPYQITSAIHIIDSSGVIQYNYLLPESLIINQMHSTMDGGNIAMAYPYSGNPGQVFKTDSLGALEWVKGIDSLSLYTNAAYVTDIIEASNGGYIGIMNCQFPDTNLAPWYNILVRLDSLGDTLWTKSFNQISWNLKITKDPSNNYLLYNSNELILLDSSGTIQWSKYTLDTISGMGFGIADCKLTPDSCFIFSGDYYDFSIQARRTILCKLDTTGAVQWLRSYARMNTYYTMPLALAKDGGFAFLTPDLNNSACVLVKTDSNGASICDSLFSIPVFTDTLIQPVQLFYGIHPFNLQIINTAGSPVTQYYNASFTQNGICLLLNNKEIFSEDYSIIISPNPAGNQFVVRSKEFVVNATIEIFDLIGEKIYSANFKNELTIDGTLFPKGIYFVRLSDSEKLLTQKLVIE
ncbi:MAG: T9SS type A sorting domain-containing protein [Bacteroidota bacterium]